ncbi:MAG: hypothetical protein ACREND_06800, partial [Gemmatimonadaceae bacterium]
MWAASSATATLDEWARHLARYHPRVIAVDRAVDRVRHVDADAARHWRRVQRAKRANCRRLAAWLSRSGELASPWTVDSAADMLCALVASDIIETLLVTRSWSRRNLARHLSALLRATFVLRTLPLGRSHGLPSRAARLAIRRLTAATRGCSSGSAFFH